MVSVETLCIGGPLVTVEIPDAPRLIRVHFASQGKGGRNPGLGPALVGAVASVSLSLGWRVNGFFLYVSVASLPPQPVIGKGRVSS